MSNDQLKSEVDVFITLGCSVPIDTIKKLIKYFDRNKKGYRRSEFCNAIWLNENNFKQYFTEEEIQKSNILSILWSWK